MFTRLDEMREGDFFYIEVMGETLGYEVDRIDVIEPSETSRLRVVKGEDRVTLMTCTPYGVNTHRLLVSGHRVKIPVPAPDPNAMHDPMRMGVYGVCLFPAGCSSLFWDVAAIHGLASCGMRSFTFSCVAQMHCPSSHPLLTRVFCVVLGLL